MKIYRTLNYLKFNLFYDGTMQQLIPEKGRFNIKKNKIKSLKYSSF
jgi:hypothetical protein